MLTNKCLFLENQECTDVLREEVQEDLSLARIAAGAEFK
jgi:hypothetical protein